MQAKSPRAGHVEFFRAIELRRPMERTAWGRTPDENAPPYIRAGREFGPQARGRPSARQPLRRRASRLNSGAPQRHGSAPRDLDRSPKALCRQIDAPKCYGVNSDSPAGRRTVEEREPRPRTSGVVNRGGRLEAPDATASFLGL